MFKNQVCSSHESFKIIAHHTSMLMYHIINVIQNKSLATAAIAVIKNALNESASN